MVRAQDKAVEGTEVAVHARHLAEKAHAVGDAQFGGQRLQRIVQATVSGDGQQRVGGLQAGEGADQRCLVLVRVQAADIAEDVGVVWQVECAPRLVPGLLPSL